jgi:hypothetical protein
MAKRSKASKAMPFDPADVANIAKTNPYIQRLISDARLRDNVRVALDSSKSAYGRLSNGKAPAKAVLQDKKLQRDLRAAFEAARDAVESLQEAPKKRARKGMSFGRKLMILAVGGALAIGASEKLRSKVLDTLFGAEEDFQYTPPATTTTSDSAASAPVSAA